MPKRKNKKVPHAEQLPSGRYRCRVYDSETKKQRSFIADTPEEAEIMAKEWKLDHEIKPPGIVPSGFLLCFVFLNVLVK